MKSQLTCKLLNRIPVSLLLISSLPDSALRTYVESLSQPLYSTSILEALPCKLDIKRHSPSIFLLFQTGTMVHGLFNLIHTVVTDWLFKDLLNSLKFSIWLLKLSLSLKKSIELTPSLHETIG